MKENAYGLRENPKKTWRSLHHLLPDLLHPPPRIPLEERAAENNVASSWEDDRKVADAALSLVMISRDRWDRPGGRAAERGMPRAMLSACARVKTLKVKEARKDGGVRRKRRRTGGGVYGCATCGKTFRSHQALGGHSAGAHRRSRREGEEDEEVEEEEEGAPPVLVDADSSTVTNGSIASVF